MARNKKTPKIVANEQVATQVVIGPPTLSAEDIAAKIRNDELSTARGVHTAAMGGRSVAKAGMMAGSDLVGRCLRAAKLLDGNDFVTPEQVIEALRAADPNKVLAVIESHISALIQNKANLARLDLFRTFVKADGLNHLANAYATFAKYRAWQYGETIAIYVKSSKTNRTMPSYSVDVRADITNMFGLKLTFARRARYGSYVAS